MPLEINQDYSAIAVKLPAVKTWLQTCLVRLCLPAAQVSVLLTGDEEIRRINREYRGVDRATDVLSFGMREQRQTQDPLPPHPEILGDLVISLPTIQRQAQARGVVLEAELKLMLAHGLLHLLGYDHRRPLETKQMFVLQEQMVNLPVKGLKRRGSLHRS